MAGPHLSLALDGRKHFQYWTDLLREIARERGAPDATLRAEIEEIEVVRRVSFKFMNEQFVAANVGEFRTYGSWDDILAEESSPGS